MPTYNPKELTDPLDKAAWMLSEQFNENAPLGWTRYRRIIRYIVRDQELMKLLTELQESR